MIEHPYLLLLLLLFPVYFYYRNVTKYYFRHAYLDNLRNKASKGFFRWQYLILAGAFFLTLAACNIVWKNTEVVRVYQVHKYVLVNDGSGSMVNAQKENGIGDQLTAVLSGNDKLFDFLGRRKDGSKDLVGAIVFADDAFTVSGLTDDPRFVQKKLKRIDYRLPPMSGGTDIESGLWAALEMLLSQNNEVKQEELDHLQFMFYGGGNDVKKDEMLDSIVARKDKFAGSSIIIFTDGIFNAVGDQNKMSSFKIINFCKLLGIRVYFISIFDLNKNLITVCRDTGGRGDVVKGYDQKRLEQIYEEIATSQANEYTTKEQTVDHSLSDLLGIGGLYLVLLGLFFHNTTQLNFTEV